MTSEPRNSPQQERSRETRSRILESTVTCLATKGWQSTTASAVAAHCGISPGALQHHFPTREGLFLTALEQMFDEQAAANATPAALADGTDRFDLIVEQVLGYDASDLFKAALQIWTAAAAEPALRENIRPLEEKFARRMYDNAVLVLCADTSDERTRRLIQTTLDLARGLGLADVLSDDSVRRRKIAHFRAEELRSIKTAHPTTEQG